MLFFKRRAKRESALLIDIGSGSIGAAYLSYGGARKPALHHAVRMPIAEHDASGAVAEVIKRVVTEGSPLLRDATGSGYASRAIVSIASPWQELRVRTARKESVDPFAVTHGVLAELTEPKDEPAMGFSRLASVTIAILLNGYQVKEAIGKRAKNAEAVTVTTYAEERLMESVKQALREHAHVRAVSVISFPWLSYAAIRDLYPHERDYLILDAAGRATDISVVSRTLLADTATATKGVATLTSRASHPISGNETLEAGVHVIRDFADASAYETGKQEWLASIKEALGALAKRQALPRTIFLLADADALAYVKALMDDPSIRSLWLTDEPLSVLPVRPAELSGRVAADAHDANDLFLLLLAAHALRAEN